MRSFCFSANGKNTKNCKIWTFLQIISLLEAEEQRRWTCLWKGWICKNTQGPVTCTNIPQATAVLCTVIIFQLLLKLPTHPQQIVPTLKKVHELQRQKNRVIQVLSVLVQLQLLTVKCQLQQGQNLQTLFYIQTVFFLQPQCLQTKMNVCIVFFLPLIVKTPLQHTNCSFSEVLLGYRPA